MLTKSGLFLLTVLGLNLLCPNVQATDWCNHANVEGAWLLDDASGGAVDCSSNGIDGTQVGTITYSVSGAPFGTGFETADGANYIDFTDSALDITGTSFACVGWLWRDTTSEYSIWIARSNGTGGAASIQYQCTWDSAGGGNQIHFDFYNGSLKSADSTTAWTETGSWEHLAIVYDGSNIKFFKDATADGTPAQTAALTSIATDTSVLLTSRPRSTGGDLDGRADEIAVFTNGSFGTTEIGDMMNNGLSQAGGVERRIWVAKVKTYTTEEAMRRGLWEAVAEDMTFADGKMEVTAVKTDYVAEIEDYLRNL